jgi:hypothetical protein
MESLTMIDHSTIKSNQAVIIILSLLAFIINAPWLVILVSVIMALGTLLRRPGFGFIYHYMLKPMGWVKTDLRLDHHEPHNFSQGLGSLFLGAGSIAYFLGAPTLGWMLVWMVIALAGLNLFAGFCVGCMIYYWLNRLEIPSFKKSPPAGIFPGKRPDTRVFDES